MSKLSRKRLKHVVNDSDEDFVADPVPSKVSKEKLPHPKVAAPPVPSETSSPNLEQEVAPGLSAGDAAAAPPCPICGKTFPPGATSARLGHLKSCGNEKGLSTETLLQVRRLEEKQAQERIALGLPPVPPALETKKRAASRNFTAKRRANARAVDPELEMALALSASLAAAEGLEDVDEVLKPTTEPVQPKKPRKEGRVARTALEVRTQAEKHQCISDRGAALLAAISEKDDLSYREPAKPSSSNLNQSRMWNLAGADSGAYRSEIMEPYCLTSSKQEDNLLQSSDRAFENDRQMQSWQALSFSWSRLLEDGQLADLKIYTKDNSIVLAHSLVMHVRCKAILDEVLEEESVNGRSRIVSWQSVGRCAARAFLKYLYTGVVPEFRSKSVARQVVSLAKNYRQDCLVNFMKAIDITTLESSDSDESNSTQAVATEDGTEELDANRIAATESPHSPEPQKNDNAENQQDEVKKGSSSSQTNELCPLQKTVSGGSVMSLVCSFDESHDECAPNGAPDTVHPVEGDCEESHPVGEVMDDLWDNFETEPLGSYHYDGAEQDQRVTTENKAEKNGRPDKPEDFSKVDAETLHQEDVHGKKKLPPTSRNAKRPEKIKSKEKYQKPRAQRKGCSPPIGSDNQNGNMERAGTSPLPDYDQMLSPALRKELHKYGLKAIPRRKAVPLLRHIHEQTHKHPVKKLSLETETDWEQRHDGLEMASQSNSESGHTNSSQAESSDSSQDVLHEESLISTQLKGDAMESSASSSGRSLQLRDDIVSFFRGRKDLHHKILCYEPIWLEEIFSTFKEASVAYAKCKLSDFMDVLDSECITFRSKSSLSRREKGGK